MFQLFTKMKKFYSWKNNNSKSYKNTPQVPHEKISSNQPKYYAIENTNMLKELRNQFAEKIPRCYIKWCQKSCLSDFPPRINMRTMSMSEELSNQFTVERISKCHVKWCRKNC